MAKKTLTEEELRAQLKALSEIETPESTHMCAMCYNPAPPQAIEVQCDSCGKIVKEYSWRDCFKNIQKIVDEMKELGFDAKLEQLCTDCANKLGLKDEDGDPMIDGRLYYVFFFKTKDQEQYHFAESSDEDEYKAVLAFLKNKPSYTDYYDFVRQVKDELDVIKKMTGISID